MPSDIVHLVVSEVVDRFYYHFSIFPLRNCFSSLADSVLHCREPTLERIVGLCRDGTKLWPESEMTLYKETVKERTQTMQGRRTAVKMFSILDQAGLQHAITSTGQYSDESVAKRRGAYYDEESNALRSLQGALPYWQKQMPVLALVYLRGTVKALQRRMYMRAGNDSNLISMWEGFVREFSAVEIDAVCNKLERYLKWLREFLRVDCYGPDVEDAEQLQKERKQFLDCLKLCRALVHSLNTALPITYGIDPTLRNYLHRGWTTECGQDRGWQLKPHQEEDDEFTLFTPSSHRDTSSLFTTLNELHELSSESSEELDVLANCQVSVLASSQLACSLIAERKCEYLSSFGQQKRNRDTRKRKREEKIGDDGRAEGKDVEMIRNIHLQADLLSLWTAIIRCDKHLDADLVSSDQFGRTEILRLSDEWYDHLIARMVVPDLVLSIMSSESGRLFAEGCSRLMKTVQKKKFQKGSKKIVVLS